LIINRHRKKILKISAYILGTIGILLTAFHFWFINHAERLLEDLVESRSNGKLKLHVKKFRFNWFSDNMQLRNAVFYSTDTATAATAYRFTVDRINIRIKEIMPLIFEKKILIDSLGLVNADIQVTRLKAKDADSTKDRNVSLPLEMGRVYKSIQDALQVLQVNRFQIDNGKFTLINKIRPDHLPVTITNIYFHLDNLQVDTDNKKKILFSDNITLSTYHQDITFPDGRHHLSFSNFRINYLKKLVEFDSCTIAATKGDSTKSSFKIFFDKLLLTNIDFDTLYQKEVIKADSVYCINPHFRLDVELGKRTGKRKPPPRLDELIQLLTGDMQLAFVAVKNGSFDINTMREGRPSSFTSDHNNFEMRGLRIEKDAPRHLTVKSFAMAIRNYENFLRDSTYAMQFDSILFFNNSVYLSNFSVRQMENENIINNFSVPQFELKGLSWDDLVFERKLTADKATLYSPVINYSVWNKKKLKNKKQDVFQVLADIKEIIQLNNLDISNGQINVHFRGGAHLKLENTTMSILSDDLVQSKRIDNLQRSVRKLKFRKGLLKLKDLEVKMEEGDFSGENGQLSAERVSIINTEKNLQIDAKKVVINKMMIESNTGKTEINGIQWQEANVQVINLPAMKKNIIPDFVLRNIHGANTKLTTSSGNQRLTVFFETLSAGEFLPQQNNKPRVINLYATGKNLSFIDNKLQLAIDHFHIADHQNSNAQNLVFKNITESDSINMTIPSLSFTPDLNSMINGTIAADNVSIIQPIINLKLFNTNTITTPTEKRFPAIIIGKILIQQPEFYLTQPEEKAFTKLEWKGGQLKNNLLELTDFKVSDQLAISAGKMNFSLNNFSFTAGGKTFTTGSGEIKTVINNFHLQPSETGEWNWNGTIADLYAKEISFDSLGKKRGQLNIISARLNNLTLKSASITNLRQLVKENKAFGIKEISGQYHDEDNSFKWFNANYDKSSKTFSVDSFAFHPVPDKESYIASQKYQADYITLQTGAIRIDQLDPDGYLSDTIINAGNITIDNAFMTVFRDKRRPSREDIIKRLPTAVLKKIPVHFSVDTIGLTNANIDYTELNENTNKAGTITFNRMNATIVAVTNQNRKGADSLLIDAEAWLMDSVKIKLYVKESYTDSLAGFLLTGSICPADARFLNPMLTPLASVEIESGFLDTLSMQVTGTEYLATGEMKMLYHDLKIKFLDTKNEKKKKFATFLANLFVIKKNNLSRTGVIFFERLRDKSSLNYLVKILMNGITSSIGIKTNKKLLLKYKKEQLKRNLPAG
jgi:hypothetical protein